MDTNTKQRLLKKAGTYQDKSQGVTTADLMEVCKAMRDHVRETLAATEGEIGLRLGKAIEQRFDKAFGEALNKSIEGYLVKRLEDLQQAFGERVEFLRRCYEEGMQRQERLIAAIQVPPPQVQIVVPELIVPPATVTVTPEVFLPPPEVVVNVAEQTLPAPVAQFVLPEINLPAPIVNVAAAEMKALPAPVVNVSIPKRRVKKTITYDQYNRPAEVVEEDENAG